MLLRCWLLLLLALRAGGGVLVHCQAGVSRSAAIVIAYCMWKEHLSADAATSLVTAARSVVWPNAGFKCQLQEFEELHWDASRWGGWSMDKYLSKQYGDESVGFMAAMLGGAPQDRVKQQMQQHHGDGQQDAGSAAWGCPRESCTTYAVTASMGDCSRSSAASVQPEADSCRSSPSGCADQQLAGRHHGKSTCKISGSQVSSERHDTVSCSSGGMCRQRESSPGGMRRMSYACYCSNAGASCTYGAAGSSHHRMRRHSTGQYALAAAAGVTPVQLGALKQLSLNAGSRLPEEAALLMAG